MADIDKQAVRELVLFAENDGQLYRQSTEPVQKNLLRKSEKGTYDHELAKKLWAIHAKRAFDRYEQEFGKGSLGQTANIDFMSVVAKEMADDFADENDLPKKVNTSVIRFEKPSKSTFSAGEFRLESLGVEKGSKEAQVLNFLNRKPRNVPFGEIVRTLQIPAAKVNEVLDFLEAKGLVSSKTGRTFVEGKDGISRPTTEVTYRATPKARQQTIVKNATTVVKVKKGNEPFATIIGRNKMIVSGDRDNLSQAIRKTHVAQPKASDPKWTITVTGVTTTGDTVRKSGLTLSQAKSLAKKIDKANREAIADSKKAANERVKISTGRSKFGL